MLLFDENLAARLVTELKDLYPGCAHLSHYDLVGSSDRTIWDHARQQGLAIVSKDGDFRELGIRPGAPPKLIWLRAANCSTAEIIRLLRECCADIRSFPENDAVGVFPLS